LPFYIAKLKLWAITEKFHRLEEGNQSAADTLKENTGHSIRLGGIGILITGEKGEEDLSENRKGESFHLSCEGTGEGLGLRGKDEYLNGKRNGEFGRREPLIRTILHRKCTSNRP